MMEAAAVHDALGFVPPDDRELWVRIGMAVKAALGDSGFEIWDEWSQRSDRYKKGDARSVWRSIKATGGIGPGTLYEAAKSRGWRGETPTIDPKVEAARKAAREAEARKERNLQVQKWRAAEKEAAEMIAGATLECHLYLIAKGFPKELVLVRDGKAIIPMRDADDRRLLSVQTITAEGEKKFLYGGRARGAVHELGNGPETFICEGFATGLSIRAAVKSLCRNARVVVSFSAANLAHVAPKYSGRRYVVADHDPTGVGKEYAQKTGLPFWIPPDVETDANDFFQVHGVRALAHELNELRRQ